MLTIKKYRDGVPTDARKTGMASRKNREAIPAITIFVLILAIVVLTGCRKEKSDTEPEQEKILIGNAYALPDSIISGETTTLYWTSENTISITLNGEILPTLSGSKTIESLTTSSVFNFTFTGENDQVLSKVVKVVVRELTQKEIMTNFLCLDVWKPQKIEVETSPGVWEEGSMSPAEARRLKLFNKNGTYKDWDPLGIGITIDNIPWYFTEDLKSMYRGGQTEEIVVLNETDLTFRYWVKGVNPQTGLEFNSHRGKKTYTHII